MGSLQSFNSKQIRLIDRPYSHYVSMWEKGGKGNKLTSLEIDLTPNDFKCLKNRNLVLSIIANKVPYICFER